MKMKRFVLVSTLLLAVVLAFGLGTRSQAQVPRPVPKTGGEPSAGEPTSPGEPRLIVPQPGDGPSAIVPQPGDEPTSIVPEPGDAPAAIVPAPPAEPSTPSAEPSPTTTPAVDLTTLPLAKGLPVVVHVAVYFATVEGIDENEGTFDATIDLRLRWEDPRLRYPESDVPGGMLELRGPAAEARLATMWSPQLSLANLVDEPKRQIHGLRLWANGNVELMVRTIAKFGTPIDLSQFPFDTQVLRVEILSLGEDVDRLFLDFRQRDLDFSRVAKGVELEEWQPGLVELSLDPVPGWHGEAQARVYASLEVARLPGRTVAAVFIPLLASLLIPMLALWLNASEDGGFKVEAFELANIVIGGLFAVVALNFTISSEYPALAGSDNTVTRLLTLNYGTLAIAVVMNLVLFRFELVRRLFGRSPQAVLFHYLMWAFPTLVFGTAIAMVLASMA